MRLDVRRLNRILGNLYNDMKTFKDDDRELPMKWSTMHMYTSSQLAVLVALKKGLDPELMGIIAALHDIGAIMTKKRDNHARNASKYIYEIINEYNTKWRGSLNEITVDETKIIHEAVVNHSDKHLISESAYAEAMKNIDSLDRYLHGIPTKGDHLLHLNKMLELLDIQVEEQ